MSPSSEPKRENGALKFPEVEDIFHIDQSKSPESLRIPEREQGAGQSDQEKFQMPETPVVRPSGATHLSKVAVPTKTPLLVEIESVMEENLREIYNQMPDEAKERFRAEGEKTANEIQKLFQSLKATTKAVLDLLRKWLKLIPGINAFFLEQEAKIKADKIMAIKLSQFQKK